MDVLKFIRITAAAGAMTAGSSGAVGAAPLVLYDPGTTTPPAGSLLQSTTSTAARPVAGCGLAAPCTDLNAAAANPQIRPLNSDLTYGLSGEVSGTVSNHGQGGEVGVLGWLNAGDTTLSLAVTVGGGRFGGRRVAAVPIGARP